MEKLGKWSLLQDPQPTMSQGWKPKRSVLLSPWGHQDRKLRLGQGQPTWESAGGTSGPLQEEVRQKLLQKAYCWVKTESWHHLSEAAVP